MSLARILKSTKPSKIWIDGATFNINHNKEGTVQMDRQRDYNIKPIDDNHFVTSFRLPELYYSKLLDASKFPLSELQSETNTEIIIRKIPCDDNCIIIKGNDVDEVANARTKLHTIISLIRDSNKAMQFISIPVLDQTFIEKFNVFKEEILSNGTIDGMHESIFQRAEKLHLTVCVFALLDDTEKAEAVNVLKDCKKDILDPLISKSGALSIKLSGIDCMNDNHSKVKVLYAKAKILNEHNEDILQGIANSILKHFYDRGLVLRYQDNVKLHVTLINTKYRTVKGRQNKWVNRKITFDARHIMENYNDFDFGESRFRSVHLSMMSSVGDDGFYKPISVIEV